MRQHFSPFNTELTRRAKINLIRSAVKVMTFTAGHMGEKMSAGRSASGKASCETGATYGLPAEKTNGSGCRRLTPKKILAR